jgi:glycosyltransferase involved in cell wall biosynthesis
MNYKISVIIPVYNVENYIRECLNSIVNQTIGIENIEVIVVNDCTPDNSMDIVEEYAEKYSSIKIIEHEINQGLGPARNTGLKHATAEYISFIDSDDFISENTYEICLYKFERYNCDFVIY